MRLLLFAIFILTAQSVFAQEEATRPVHIGLIYPISSNGLNASDYVNNFSLHLIAGLSGGERGVALSGFGHITRGDLTGAQLSGFGHVITGNAKGVSLAGFGIIHNDIKGAQLAGFGNVAVSVQGVQGAGFINICSDVKGAQGAGFMNVTRRSQGVQGAGFMNINGNFKGVQGAGFMNISSNFKGIQGAGFMNVGGEGKGVQAAGFMNVNDKTKSGIQAAGFMNISGDIEKGVQVAGFMNIAKHVKGIQASGFINIADSSDVPIGIINIIKKGEMYGQISYDDFQNLILTFRSGGRWTYGLIGLGITRHPQFGDRSHSVSQVGIGGQVPIVNDLKLRGEILFTNMSVVDDNPSFRRLDVQLLADYSVNRFNVFIGPSFGIARVNFIEPLDHWGIINDRLSSSGSTMIYDLIGLRGGVSYRLH